jgi:hypothetical protein
MTSEKTNKDIIFNEDWLNPKDENAVYENEEEEK